MTSLTSKFKLDNTSLGFAARAGLIANQPCPTIKKLLKSRPNSFLTVEVHPTDRESRSDISICASSLPKDKVIFLMPKEEVEEEDHEEDHRIPEPRAAVTGGVEPKKVSSFLFALIASLLL